MLYMLGRDKCSSLLRKSYESHTTLLGVSLAYQCLHNCISILCNILPVSRLHPLIQTVTYYWFNCTKILANFTHPSDREHIRYLCFTLYRATSLARTLATSLARTLATSLARTLATSLARTLATSPHPMWIHFLCIKQCHNFYNLQ
jgi:hypothetical protein